MGEGQSDVCSGVVEKLRLRDLVALDAEDRVAVHLQRLKPFAFREVVVVELDHEVAVVADHVVPDFFRACREVPDEVELPGFHSYFGDGPEEVALRVHEGEGPEDVVGRFVVLRLQPVFKLAAEVLQVGDVALSYELVVALVMRELERGANDDACNPVDNIRTPPASGNDEVYLLIVKVLAEGVHRGDGDIGAEVELEERDGVRPVVHRQVFQPNRFRDEGLRRSCSFLQID